MPTRVAPWQSSICPVYPSPPDYSFGEFSRLDTARSHGFFGRKIGNLRPNGTSGFWSGFDWFHLLAVNGNSHDWKLGGDGGLIAGISSRRAGESEAEAKAGQIFTGPLQVFGIDSRKRQHLGARKGLPVVLEALEVVEVSAFVVADLQVGDLLGACLLLEYQRGGCVVGDDLGAGHGADFRGAAHLVEKGFGDGHGWLVGGGGGGSGSPSPVSIL